MKFEYVDNQKEIEIDIELSTEEIKSLFTYDKFEMSFFFYQEYCLYVELYRIYKEDYEDEKFVLIRWVEGAEQCCDFIRTFLGFKNVRFKQTEHTITSNKLHRLERFIDDSIPKMRDKYRERMKNYVTINSFPEIGINPKEETASSKEKTIIDFNEDEKSPF